MSRPDPRGLRADYHARATVGKPVLARAHAREATPLLDELLAAARIVERAGLADEPAGVCIECSAFEDGMCSNKRSRHNGRIVGWAFGCARWVAP